MSWFDFSGDTGDGGGFFSGIFDTVTDWFSGSGGDAAGDSGIWSAIADSAVDGAITGLLSGAIAAWLNDEDIMDGALTGAAYGGAIGGLLGGVSGVLDNLSGVDEFSDSSQMDNIGASWNSNNITDNSSNGGTYDSWSNTENWSVDPGITESVSNLSTSSGSSRGSSSNSNSNSDGGSSWWNSETAASVLGNAAASGLDYLSQQSENDAADARQEDEQAEARAVIAANQPGDFEVATANINVNTWWDDHINSSNGLLSTGTA